MRTYSPKPGEVNRTWHVIDAEDVVLGRLATQVATLLRGKHKPTFAPHVDTGDFVIIVNAGQGRADRQQARPGVRLPAQRLPRRAAQAVLRRAAGHPPERLLEKVVKGMLPKNKLGRAQGKKLKVYAGPDHPHAAQQPQPFEIAKVSSR